MGRLLDQARSVTTRKHTRSDRNGTLVERLEVALAWVNGELTLTQAASGLGSNGTTAYAIMVRMIREAIAEKLIRIELVPSEGSK